MLLAAAAAGSYCVPQVVRMLSQLQSGNSLLRGGQKQLPKSISRLLFCPRCPSGWLASHLWDLEALERWPADLPVFHGHGKRGFGEQA